MNPIDKLLNLPPFTLDPQQKTKLFSQAMQAAIKHHWSHCKEFRQLCRKQGFEINRRAADLHNYPYLPAGLFKKRNLISVSPDEIKLKLMSSATSGRSSTIHIDTVTSKRQTMVSAQIIAAYIGPERRPFLILDEDPSKIKSPDISARSAATRGFLLFANSVDYFLRKKENRLSLDISGLTKVLRHWERSQKEVCFFGFTYILYTQVIKKLLQEKLLFKLPPSSKVIHIGGWKNLEDQKVSRSCFLEHIHSTLGICPENVFDFYGFTEQMGMIYANHSEYPKVTPLYSEIIIRDFKTLMPVKDGESGLVQFLSPIPHSYPGISVLTDDIGRILGRRQDSEGRWGTQFEILGRAKKAEKRGCGDILGDLMETE
jgi:hypothetical protein